jgi:hypothetical protein
MSFLMPMWDRNPNVEDKALTSALKFAGQNGLPDLNGTPKQIAYGQKIRAGMARRLKCPMWLFELITDAVTYIDHKPFNDTDEELLLKLHLANGWARRKLSDIIPILPETGWQTIEVKEFRYVAKYVVPTTPATAVFLKLTEPNVRITPDIAEELKQGPIP